MNTTCSWDNHKLSVVVPMYNEEESVGPLIKRVHEALADYAMPWELVLVDDGSRDSTPEQILKGTEEFGEHVRLVELRRNFGQTAAMQAGIDAARGDVIVTMDGDLQNDPMDIPRMVKRLLDDDLDMVAGWRKDRKDALVMRKIPSRIANRLIKRITGVYLHDYGCSLKAFRAEIIKGVRLYGEMHRFIPAWLATQTKPSRIGEEVVTHHARAFGTSKYGISRTFRVILDLLVVFFFMRFNARPGHFFGQLSLMLGSVGGLIMAYLFVLKLMGESIGTRPLFMVGILLILVAVQIFSTGVVSEMLTRTYYESGNAKSYVVRRSADHGEESGWKSAKS